MSLDQVSTEDLMAYKAGDLSKISDEGLQNIKAALSPQIQQPPVAEPEPQQDLGSIANRLLQNIGYAINSADPNTTAIGKGTHSYTVLGKDITPILEAAIAQTNPLNHPIDKVTAFVDKLGGSGGFSPVNNFLNTHVSQPIVDKILQAVGSNQTAAGLTDQMKGMIGQAVQNQPIAAAAGSIGNGMAVVPLAGEAAAPIAKALPSLAGIIPAAVTGAAGGAASEVASNPNATAGSIAKSAGIGGLTSSAIASATALGNKFSQWLVNYATDTGDTKIAKYINDELGPTLTKTSLLDKNEKVLNATENELQSHLKTLDKHGKTVNMREVAQDPDLLKDALSLDNVGEKAKANAILKKLSDYEDRGNITLSDANKLKRDLYQSFFDNKGTKPGLARFQRQVSLALKDAIEESSGSDLVKQLNSKLSDGIQLKESLGRSSLGSKIADVARAGGEIGAIVHSGGSALPGIAAERLATSLPVVTTIGAGASGLNNLAKYPIIQALLGSAGSRVGQ